MVVSSIRAVDGIFDKASGGQNAEKKTTTFNYFINLLSALWENVKLYSYFDIVNFLFWWSEQWLKP